MLTKRQNLIEVISGGQPDRFANQFEAFALTFGHDPLVQRFPSPRPGETLKNGWGVTASWVPGTPAPISIHKDGLAVVNDITRWRTSVKAPDLDFSEEEWGPLERMVATVDRNEQFLTAFKGGGVFETFHSLQGMESALLNLAIEPEASHELLEYCADWIADYMTLIINRIKPDAILQTDDYGSAQSTMMSADMFKEFFVPLYKRLNGLYKSLGVKLIVHHNDSYSATLVPAMIEMGIDIWQGPISNNNIGELVKQYGGQISFMGGLDAYVIDEENWTQEGIDEKTKAICDECGKKYFIPCITHAAPVDIYDGVYDAVSSAVERINDGTL